jgi:hypothetical protein
MAMESAPSTSTPLGLILIAVFWVVVGTLIISQIAPFLLSSSFVFSIIGLIVVFLGTGFILIGWGLLVLKRWAFFSALILSLLSLIPLALLTISLFISFIMNYRYYIDYLVNLYVVSSVLILLGFILMIWYLLKNISLVQKKQ